MSLRVAAVVIAALVTAPGASAATRITSVDTSGFPALRVTVVVPAGSAKPTLVENGRAVAGLRAVNLGAAKSIVLALDRSQSMRGRPLANAISAAQLFVGRTGAADRVGIVAFGRSAVSLTRTFAQPADAGDLLAGLSVDSKAGTALYDAVMLAANQLRNDTRAGRAIVVVTDGSDVSSSHSLEDAVGAARRAHAAVYTIGIAGPDFDGATMRRLTVETGGSYRLASSTASLAATYAALRDELARTWTLSYLTSARPGSLVRVSVTVPGAGTAVRSLSLPGGDGAAVAPTGLLPAGAYDGAGTAVLAIAVGLLLLLACRFWFASRRADRVTARIEPHLGTSGVNGKLRRRDSRAATRARVADAIEHMLADVKQFKQVQRLIERADLPLRTGELLGGCAAAGLLLGVLAVLTQTSFAITLVLVVLGAGAPLAFVALKARARLRQFENQLPDLLITLAASLKAGHSFRHGIQSVVEEGAEPAAQEFKRVMTETQLGKPIDDALAHMAERVGSKNFSFVITAVTIQRQIGGSLSGLFDMVAETVRQRQQFGRKVKSLTAMGRMSAYVLVGLPFFLAATVTLLNPVYMAPLYHTGVGQKLIIAAVVMIAIGSLMLQRIASFRG